MIGTCPTYPICFSTLRWFQVCGVKGSSTGGIRSDAVKSPRIPQPGLGQFRFFTSRRGRGAREAFHRRKSGTSRDRE